MAVLLGRDIDAISQPAAAKQAQDWKSVLDQAQMAQDRNRENRNKVDLWQLKGEALVMLGQNYQDPKSGLTKANMGKDCLVKAQGLCTSQQETKEKEKELEGQVKKSLKVIFFKTR